MNRLNHAQKMAQTPAAQPKAPEKRRLLSVVVPVFNEEGNVAALYTEIRAVCSRLASSDRGYESEIIFVNDGSTDGTLNALRSLAGVTVIDLNRNYGQGTALDAGFRAAHGDVIITLDGDGQNDPADMPKLLAALDADPDIDTVAGWRKDRRDKKGIVILSKFGRSLRRLFIGDAVHDAGCTLRAYRAKAAKSLELSGEMHRYIVALLRWNGFRIVEMAVNHRPRLTGASKYSYAKALRGGFDLLYVWFLCKYSDRPVHFFGYISVGSFAAGLLLGALSVFEKITVGISFNRNGWFFISLFLLISALISFGFGMLFDLVVHGHPNGAPSDAEDQNRSRRYHVRQVFHV